MMVPLMLLYYNTAVFRTGKLALATAPNKGEERYDAYATRPKLPKKMQEWTATRQIFSRKQKRRRRAMCSKRRLQAARVSHRKAASAAGGTMVREESTATTKYEHTCNHHDPLPTEKPRRRARKPPKAHDTTRCHRKTSK